MAAAYYRDQEVEKYGPRQAGKSVERYKYDGGKDDRVAAEVLADLEILELGGEHLEVSHHCERQKHYFQKDFRRLIGYFYARI